MKNIGSRIEHIDIAKGIGIIMILASHVIFEIDRGTALESAIYIQWTNILGSFYVPVFFLLSGIFESKNDDWSSYWKRLLRLVRYIIVFLLWGVFVYFAINRQFDITKAIKGCVHTVWFLYVLTYITIIWGVIKRTKLYVQMILTILLGGAGYIMASKEHSYFYIGQAFLCIPFYAVGVWLKEWLLQTTFRWKVAAASFVLWILPTLFSVTGLQNISLNQVGRDFLCFYTAAFAGSVLMIEFCKLLHGHWGGEFVGRNSLIIMMVHPCLGYINYHILHIHIDSWWMWILFVLSWTLISICMVPIFRNKFFKII